MAGGWNAGTFTRFEGSSGCATKEAGGIGITSAFEDQRFNEFATGINTCLTKDGQNTATANLPMGGFIHTNVGAATAITNYARASQVQSGIFLYGGTSGGSANAQTVTNIFTPADYSTGQEIWFKAGATNTSSLTVQLNSLSAVTVKTNYGNSLIGGEVVSGGTYGLIYNGANLILLNPSILIKTWTPTIGTLTGSLSSTSILAAQYSHDSNGYIDFIASFTTTLSGGPSNVLTMTTPITASGSFYEVFAASQIFTAATYGCHGKFLNTDGTLIQIYCDNPATTFGNGDLNIRMSGRYR